VHVETPGLSFLLESFSHTSPRPNVLFFGILDSLDDVGVSCLHPLIEEIEVVLFSGTFRWVEER